MMQARSYHTQQPRTAGGPATTWTRGGGHAWLNGKDLGLLINNDMQTVQPANGGRLWNLYQLSSDGKLTFVNTYGSVFGAPPPPAAAKTAAGPGKTAGGSHSYATYPVGMGIGIGGTNAAWQRDGSLYVNTMGMLQIGQNGTDHLGNIVGWDGTNAVWSDRAGNQKALMNPVFDQSSNHYTPPPAGFVPGKSPGSTTLVAGQAPPPPPPAPKKHVARGTQTWPVGQAFPIGTGGNSAVWNPDGSLSTSSMGTLPIGRSGRDSYGNKVTWQGNNAFFTDAGGNTASLVNPMSTVGMPQQPPPPPYAVPAPSVYMQPAPAPVYMQQPQPQPIYVQQQPQPPQSIYMQPPQPIYMQQPAPQPQSIYEPPTPTVYMQQPPAQPPTPVLYMQPAVQVSAAAPFGYNPITGQPAQAPAPFGYNPVTGQPAAGPAPYGFDPSTGHPLTAPVQAVSSTPTLVDPNTGYPVSAASIDPATGLTYAAEMGLDPLTASVMQGGGVFDMGGDFSGLAGGLDPTTLAALAGGDSNFATMMALQNGGYDPTGGSLGMY